MKNLLQIRQQIKRKKPDFIRQKGKFLKKLGAVWRAPKGMHSKLRMKHRGHISHPSMGYSSPREVRGLSPTGLRPILITNESQLSGITQNDGLIISKRLGERKRISILKKTKERNIKILNIHDVDAYIATRQKEMTEKKEQKKKEQQKKESAKKVLEEKSAEKKEETKEEKEKKDKEEKRKVLESRQ